MSFALMGKAIGKVIEDAAGDAVNAQCKRKEGEGKAGWVIALLLAGLILLVKLLGHR
jgi:hypothetical protein